LQAGTAELNRIHNEMPLDKVMEILEDTNEAIEVN
jgi:hypothetical protein